MPEIDQLISESSIASADFMNEVLDAENIDSSETAEEFVLPPKFDLQVPNLFEHFGIWMIEPDYLRNAVKRVQGINLHAHVSSQEAQERVKQQSRANYQSTDEGIAIFRVQGPMMKRTSSLSDATSTVRLRSQIRSARQSGDVAGGLLVMDTPGGSARGNSDLADEVRRFAQEKPLFGFVEDMTASAGVSVISQATQIWANNEAAIYGSMGTYAVLEDLSGAADKIGLRVVVVRAGEFKGMGEPGTEITEEQIAEIQRIVNRLNDQYLEQIAQGRNRSVDSVRSLADGRVIFADDALSNGLIDQIGTFGQAINSLRSLAGVPKSTAVQITETIPQQKETDEMDHATLQELKQTFPNADSDWIVAQLEKQATLLDASQAYAQHVETKATAAAEAAEEQQKQIQEQHEKELSEVKAAATQQSGNRGWQPFTSGAAGDMEIEETGDPIADFDHAVLDMMNSHNLSREKAIGAVRRTQPKLAQAYLLATNNTKFAQRVLHERFDSLGVA